MNRPHNAGDCINAAVFWLEGLTDGTSRTRREHLALLAQAIAELNNAFIALAYEE